MTKHSPDQDKVAVALDWCELALRRIVAGSVAFFAIAAPDWVQNGFRGMIEFARLLGTATWPSVALVARWCNANRAQIARMGLLAGGWLVLALFPVALLSVGLPLWVVGTWSLIVVFGSIQGYLRWRAIEETARSEWRDWAVNGLTIQEMMAIVKGEDTAALERIAAVSMLVEAGTCGHVALMAALAEDESNAANVNAKLWILAALGALGPVAQRFELSVQNLRVMSNVRMVKQAAQSTLRKISLPIG